MEQSSNNSRSFLSTLSTQQLRQILLAEVESDETNVELIRNITAVLEARDYSGTDIDVKAAYNAFLSDHTMDKPLYKIEMATVDKDALDFLKVIYFGAITDPYEAAAFRAYRDFNRTLRFGDMEDAARIDLRRQATDILWERISKIAEETHMTQGEFDSWHKETCRLIRQPYVDAGIDFSWGQAQKWLNMTIKYLYIVGTCSFDGVFQFCHIPVDKYVFQIAKKELGIPVPKIAWSRWTDYDGQYMVYQKELRSRIKGFDPLRWEFKYWMKEARHLADENE